MLLPIIKIVDSPKIIVDIERVKLSAKIVGDERNEEVTDAIATAQQHLEVELGRLVGERVLSLTFNNWQGSTELPFDINKINSLTSAGNELSGWGLQGRALTIEAEAPVVIEVVCGWSDKTLPAPLKSAILMLATDLLENPSAQTASKLYINDALESLISLWRLRPFI